MIKKKGKKYMCDRCDGTHFTDGFKCICEHSDMKPWMDEYFKWKKQNG